MATKEPQDEDTDIVKLEDSDSSTTKGKNAGDKSSDTQSPHRLKPVRVYGHPNVTSGDSKSVVEVGNTKMEDTRKTNTAGNETKTCYFFKDHDHSFPGVKVAINPRRYKKFDTLLQELSKKIPGLGFGVRTVATPDGKDRISNLDGLTHDGNYICTSSRLIVRGLDISRVAPREVWRLARPPSGRRIYNNMLREDFNYTESKVLKRTVKQRSNQMYRAYVRNEPKKVTVLKNSDPTQKHLLLLNRRTGQQFEQVLSDLSGMFGFRIEKLYTTEGRKQILGLNQLFKAPDTLVCCGDERFDPMGGRSTSRVMSRVSLHTRGSDVVSRKMRSRRERMANTKGRWKVWITTNGNKAASTQAQVTITVYGHKGNSGPISLGTGDGSQFQSGNIDEFEEINIGNVGEIYKIRIAHDNSGDSPGWLCDEIRMKDLDTDEELQFVCHRWLARDEDDGEICRELPAVRKYEPSLSLVRYSVYVTTGSLWNAGTDANVYMTMYGDKGDTGVRQLYSSNKSSLFKQGKTDMFTVEAVALGHLKRIIVGHDGTGPGLGWHLERIVVKEPGHKEHEANVFYCGKWLDEGEDDGKIVRELKLQDEYMDDILEKRNWEHERWKFDKDCQVKLFSLASGKAVRGKANGSLDAQGRDMDMSALFNVGVKKTMVRLFGSVTNPNSYITIDSGKMSMNGKGGPFCEFRVRVQGDRSVMLESVKNPLQFLTFGEGGQPENVKGILDKEKTRRFFVFCKGMFRHRGVVMFSSSLTQTITINPDMTMTALGKKAKMAHFRVHKVGNGVRMFESIAHPGKYIRLKDGKIDCLGERNEFSQFLVEKRKSGGYVSLQSAKQRGLYLGMKPDGRVWPTVDTGVNNIHLFPEVIEYGEWGIEVSTLEDLRDASVTIVAYGDKGNTGAILLGAPPGEEVFLAGNNDQFKANLLKAGKLYKIRLELVPKSKNIDPSWRVKEVILTNLNTKEVMTFKFNRWLSREHEDAEIMRELPAIRKDEETPQVLKYQVMVYTGEEEEASTDANVYLNIYGEKGDTGKRQLIHSSYSHKFQSGQVDVFEVEAVWLGKLEKCVVGHDATESGKGWYLSQIIVRENEDAKEEYIFSCEKWLDSGKSDQSIERTLMVKVEKIPCIVDGDWNITMTTGKGDSMATSNMVFLYAYGSKDSIGPLKLGSGKDGNFLSGKEDKVKVSIGRSVGELYKVRIGHNEAYPDSGWFLEKLNLQDCVTGDAFSIDVDRWLSRSQDDGDIWREFAVPQGGKPALPVVTYTLTVNTGSESGSNTSASVFICLHGNKGDTGKRKLFKSKDTNNPFQVGAHDTFELEAVSLEGIERITIGHDGKGSDPGWYLDSVNITDSHTGQELYFHCDRWLDEKKGDHKCEVDLYPGEEPSESRGEYSIVLKTAEDSSPSCGGRVNMCVYGSKGKSEDITLYAPDPTADLFEPGNIDSFVITVGDLGDLYKIRITREDRDDWEAWHLMEVKMHDIDSKKEHMFACDCWLSRSREDFDIVREIPIALPSKQPPPVNKYEVSVKTGHHWAAETDAVLFINIIGDKGDSGRHRLYHAIDTKGDKFQRGQTDTFVFEAVSLGELTEVQVGHDSTGHGAGIYIDTVTVVEKNGPVSSDKFIFPCNAWLDKREGDGKTWRILPLMEGQYSVLVKTSDVPDAGTQAQVYITGFGNKGKSKQMSLGSGEQGQVLFDRATETEVSVNFGNIGEIMKIRLEHDNTNSSPSWHVDWVKLTDIDTNEELVFYINEWFAIDEGDGQIMREFSVDKPGDMPLPLTQYVVVVTTSKDSDPMASHGLVSLNLIGQFGDTGMRPLNQSILSDSSPWKPGSEDVFIIEAVSVGKVETIQLQYEGQDTVWCVEKVHVYERLAAISQTVFNCYKAFGTKDQGPVVMEEFKYSAIKPGMCPTKVVEKYYGDIAPVLSKGSYSVSVHCGNQSQSGTEDDVYMVIHGVKDQSEPIHINKTDKFHRGAVIHHNVETKGLGAIVKLRIFFGGEFTGSGWFLKKVKVKDNDTKEELQFIYNDLLTCTEDNPDGSVELPAIRPDIAPLEEDEYTFYIATGNRPEAATESDVFCELIGDWGSSGRRLLTQSKNKVPFKRGQVDEFRFKGLDLGNLKECVISLNDRGRGRGWFCDRLLVKSNLDPSLKIFQCNHWMDTGCEDRQLVRRLHKFGIMPVTPPPTGKSKGRWSCEVVTADKEDLPKLAHDRPPKSREVSLIVYGSNSVKGPIELINTDGMETFLPGHTDNFPSLDLGDIGAIQKIRVCAGYEQDPNTVWTIHKVILTDDDTGEVLTYDFSQWLGEVAGDIRKELPTIKMGQGYKQVIPYYVEVHTSDEEMDSDTYSNIFITLYGLIADTGRRHLVESRSNKIKFQTGKVDVFIIDAVDLGDLEKVVIAKGPGNPWLLDKVVVKPGEFASEQYVFQHNKWIGTKDQQHIELEETLRLTTVQTSFVATNETKQLPESNFHEEMTDIDNEAFRIFGIGRDSRSFGLIEDLGFGLFENFGFSPPLSQGLDQGLVMSLERRQNQIGHFALNDLLDRRFEYPFAFLGAWRHPDYGKILVTSLIPRCVKAGSGWKINSKFWVEEEDETDDDSMIIGLPNQVDDKEVRIIRYTPRMLQSSRRGIVDETKLRRTELNQRRP
ncbi:hypothetical protein FSP39_025311 [Pinctada imbricata]|uniref:Uncharacterized protein n=1 Tax=Pinctada imbricata TaxID=66713 RepID=A0AA89BYB7_PINIB|nr:hypothetical protein FSP39_025311 [Pinctada imbricata]